MFRLSENNHHSTNEGLRKAPGNPEAWVETEK